MKEATQDKNPSGGLLRLLTAWMLCSLLLSAFTLPAAAESLISDDLPAWFDVSADISLPSSGSSVLIVLHRQADGEGCRITAGRRQVQVSRVSRGKERRLASFPMPEKKEHRLLLQRRGGSLAVIADGTRLGAVHDGTLSGGEAHLWTMNGAVADSRYQPIEPIYFADDFMRPEDETGAWEFSGGTWKATAVGDPTRSANPFSCSVTRADKGLAVGGYDLWSDYSFEASAKALANGIFGLAAYYRDKENYILFRWTPGGEGKKELIRMRDGIGTVLAEAPGGFNPGQWYRLRLRVSGDLWQVFVGGSLVLSTRDGSFGQGQAALYAETGEAWFDDVLVTSHQAVSDDFSAVEPGKWSFSDSGWRISPAGAKLLQRRSSRPGEAACGEPDWSDYSLTAEARPEAGSSFGITYLRGKEGSYIFSVASGGRQASLYRVEKGRRRLIESAPCLAPANRWHTLRADIKEGHQSLKLNGKTIIEHFDTVNVEGRAGLWAAGKADFRYFALSFGDGESNLEEVTEQFTLEDTMREWASDTGAWYADTEKGLYWHKGSCYGDFDMAVASGDLFAAGGKTEFIVNAEKTRLDGYRVIYQVDRAASKVGVRIMRREETAFEGSLELAEDGEIRLKRRGSYLLVENGDKRLLFKDPRPLAGIRTGVALAGTSLSREKIAFRPDRVMDYTFRSAPVDWPIASGKWELTNRWSCSPQWSWFGGGGEQVSAIWHEQSFSGDITVELYASFRMDLPRPPSYSRPSDICLTLFGDGKTLSSGYSLIYGADFNTATRIMRRSEIVAETSDPKFLLPVFTDRMPNTNDLHRRWFYLRAEKRGDMIRLYIDNTLALEYRDPEPLTAGRVALWTWNNEIMIARAIISYQDREASVLQAAAPAASPAAESMAAAASTTHPAIVRDFEQDAHGCTVQPEEAEMRLVAGENGRALRITNMQSGGRFGLVLLREAFDARMMPLLSLRYRLEPGVKTDLYLRMEGSAQLYRVRLNGPPESISGIVEAGSAAGVIDDGKWHTLRLNLFSILHRLLPGTGKLMVDELRLASLSTSGYLMCGFGGNHNGAFFDIDDLHIYGPGGAKAEIALDAEPGSALAFVLDRQPYTEAPTVAASEGRLSRDGLEDGLWHLHYRSRLPDGRWGLTRHHPLLVDTSGPLIRAIRPREGEACGDSSIHLEISDLSGVDPGSLLLEMAGKSFGPERGLLEYDPLSASLKFNMGRAGLRFKDGETLRATILKAADLRGNQAAPFSWSWKVDYAAAGGTAPLIRSSLADLRHDDFESGLEGWNADPRQVSITLAERGPDEPGRALRITCLDSGLPGRVTAPGTPYNAGRYQMLSFSYRVPPRMRLDLIVKVSGKEYSLQFTDNTSGLPRLGKLEEIVADDTWRRAEVNLYALLRQTVPGDGNYIIEQISLGDSGWMGNMKGNTCYIDDFRIHPVLGPAENIAWETPDISGHSRSFLSLSAPGVTPAERWLTESALPIGGLESGLYSLKLLAVNGAGRQGEESRHIFLVDTTAPLAAGPIPAAGSRSAPSHIILQLIDRPSGALDPLSIRLKVDDTVYSTQDKSLVYDAPTQRLTWSPGATEADPIYYPDGRKVQVSLTELSDYAGNSLGTPFSWEWTMDFSADRTPPPPPEVVPAQLKVYHYEDFEADDSLPDASERDIGTTVMLEKDDKSDQRFLRISQNRESRPLRAPLLRRDFDAAQYPLLHFDYRLPATARVALSIQTENTSYAISVTLKNRQHVGEMTVTADNTWHHAELDLLQVLKRALPGRDKYIVKGIDFTGPASQTPAERTSFSIDNLAVAVSSGKSAAFSLKPAYDPTGTSAVSYTWNRNPGTLPEAKPSEMGQGIVCAPQEAGLYYLHARVRDGAGNWGPARHYPFIIDP